MLRAALDVRIGASRRTASAEQQETIEAARADLEGERAVDVELREALETVRMQIEAAHIAAAAHANVAKDARAALRAERLAGATLHRLITDLEQRIAATEKTFAATRSDPRARLQALERERQGIERAWSEAEARLERTNRDWSLEVERIRHSVAAAQAQALNRYGQLLEQEQRLLDAPHGGKPESRQNRAGEPGRENAGKQLPLLEEPPERAPQPLPVVISQQRIANRQPFNERVQVQVDGEAALLVDLSVRGAQVVSKNALKPNRAVKILLPVGEKPISCKGQVVWARLEPIAPGALRYRAGMCFTNADETAIAGFMTQHSLPQSPAAPAQ